MCELDQFSPIGYLHSPAAVTSPDGVILQCSKTFLELFGIQYDCIGKNIRMLFKLDEEGTIVSSLANTGETVVSLHTPLKDSHGALQGILIESFPKKNGIPKYCRKQRTVKHHEALWTFDSIKFVSSERCEIIKQAKFISAADMPVLITGETGVGKDILAQAIHMASHFACGPFVAVNCAAIPAELIEAELFGYGSGAFTGAKSGGNIGKFEMADGGTIFLDEIGELPLPMQAKLLRVLETGEIQKLGNSRQHVFSRFRLLTATNQDLEQLVRQAKFRADLYYRINVCSLRLPPLREHKEDVPVLANSILAQLLEEKQAERMRISEDVHRLMTMYDWPGNIRELKNVLMYAMNLSRADTSAEEISLQHIPRWLYSKFSKAGKTDFAGSCGKISHQKRLYELSENAECIRIERTLIENQFNKERTATALHMSRSTLYRKMKHHGIAYSKTAKQPCLPGQCQGTSANTPWRVPES